MRFLGRAGGWGVVVVLTLACGTSRHDRPLAPISGVRFVATAELTGLAGDTLRVLLSAHNRSTRPRRIDAGGGCGDALVLRAWAPGARAPAWDSGVWRQEQAARLAARRDTTSDGRPVVYACAPVAFLVELPPGGSGPVTALAIPVRAVLGDSLRAGRYRIDARLGGNGWQAGYIAAGDVELRPPPT